MNFAFVHGLHYRCLTMFGEGRLRLGIKKGPILFFILSACTTFADKLIKKQTDEENFAFVGGLGTVPAAE